MRQLDRHKLRYPTGSFVCAAIMLSLLIVAGLLIPGFSNRLANAARNAQIGETSADRVWTNIRTGTAELAAEQRGIRAFTALQLDQAKLKQLLAAAPMEFTAEAKSHPVTLTLPLANGSFGPYRIVESPIMAPELAARFPEIKTYSGQGIDDPTSLTRFDWTLQGFHGMVLSSNGTVLIEPSAKGDTTNYLAYFQRDVPVSGFECGVSEAEQETSIAGNRTQAAPEPLHTEVSGGSTLRTYRLAVAATAEYTQTYGGGTVNGALSAITTTINLVNAIYQREAAIRLVLIANETSIIFTDSASDGYTTDTVSSLITENQTKLDTVIGDANYDIGHVFDGRQEQPGFFSFQGLASIGVVCRSGLKGRGVSITRSVQPSSVIAYYSTSHEMGHQFSATHTFNANTGNCASQRASSSAYEPGTGTTIMGYRFTCGSEDFMSSDTYFHNASLEQIINYSSTGPGSSCPVQTPTGNSAPTVLALQNYTIPRSTPFMLTALGADPDGNPLTYAWEEFDLGAAAPPDTDDGSRPIFRSFAPVTSPSRMFPRLADILSSTATFGESLPMTTRTMNFRVAARDNNSTGGVSTAAMQVNVRSDSGPFTITQPAAATSWPSNSDQTVTWNVANTTQSPVSCNNVKITLSTDGGNTFPIILANNTPNDGSETVRLPGLTSADARIKVEAVGNIFFNISPNLTINGVFSAQPTISNISPGNGDAGTEVTITGANFLPPVVVDFNGMQANFVQNSTTELIATVPQGATTGLVRVTTSQGTTTSGGSFVVTQPANTVKFSASSYAATEGCVPVTITVTRTGDTSVTTKVDFSSTDGSAVQTSDYSVAAGTLTFAPGDTLQTFNVVLNQDALVEGTETLNLTLSNVTGGTLGSPSAAVVNIGDDDNTNPPNTQPIDDSGVFVCEHYHDFLARDPDAPGQAYWTSQITQCGNDANCIHNKRVDVSNSFFYEQEFQQTGSYVYRVYRVAFGNNQPFPNPSTDQNYPNEEKKMPEYLRFMRDRARVIGGTDLAQSQLAFANAFVQRSEFISRYPLALDGPGFVDNLLLTILNDLRVDLTGQRSALINLFNQSGRGAVLYRLADDNLQTNPINNRSLIDAEYNRAFVFTEYAGYLRRNSDIGGFLFWLGQVNNGALRDGNKQHAMVCSFITATEYQFRFSTLMTHSNVECPQ